MNEWECKDVKLYLKERPAECPLKERQTLEGNLRSFFVFPTKKRESDSSIY